MNPQEREPRYSMAVFVRLGVPLCLALAVTAVLLMVCLPRESRPEAVDVFPGEVQSGQSLLVTGRMLGSISGLLLVGDDGSVGMTPTYVDASTLALTMPDIKPGVYMIHLRTEEKDLITGTTLEVVSAGAAPLETPFPVPGATPLPTPAFERTAGPAPAVKVVEILTTRPWSDTGLIVSPGDVISISASGDVIYADPDADNHTGPDGTRNPSGGCNYVVMDRSVPAQSLVGNIIRFPILDGKGFYVGSRFEGTVPIQNTSESGGKLYLGFNDGAVSCDRRGYDAWGFRGDNHGSFTVTIIVTR